MILNTRRLLWFEAEELTTEDAEKAQSARRGLYVYLYSLCALRVYSVPSVVTSISFP